VKAHCDRRRLGSSTVECLALVWLAHSRGVGLEFRAFHKSTSYSWYGGARYQNTCGFDQPSSLLLSTWETLPCLGMNTGTNTRSSTLLGIWVLRNVHPGTSAVLDHVGVSDPEQPPSVHHKPVHSVSSHLRQHQQYDFIRARTI